MRCEYTLLIDHRRLHGVAVGLAWLIQPLPHFSLAAMEFHRILVNSRY